MFIFDISGFIVVFVVVIAGGVGIFGDVVLAVTLSAFGFFLLLLLLLLFLYFLLLQDKASY